MLSLDRAGAFLSLFIPAVWQENRKSSSPFPQILWEACVIMIIAAFAGVNHFVKQGQQTSSIVVQIAKRGSGTPTTLPKDTLLLVIHRSDSINKLTVFGARHPTPEVVDITVDNLQQTLLRMEDELKNVPVLKIAIYEEKLEVNPGILIAVQKWFASHRHKRYDLTFVGPE